jgi:pseudouridine synthase
MTLIRLQKFLSNAGVCSRRTGEQYIKDGRIRVNGIVEIVLGTKVDPAIDLVEVDGKQVGRNPESLYIALNKPVGYVTSCRQPGEKIVLDMLKISERVYPVGRLDKDSTGLLLLTNDGRLHHRLSHPSFNHEKEYEVTVEKSISDGALSRIEKGLPLLGTKTRPAEVKRISARCFLITLKEGKNRQIRRMVGKVGNGVVRIKRIRFSNIKLGGLAEGNWRHLSKKEKQVLLQSLGKKANGNN